MSHDEKCRRAAIGVAVSPRRQHKFVEICTVRARGIASRELAELPYHKRRWHVQTANTTTALTASVAVVLHACQTVRHCDKHPNSGFGIAKETLNLCGCPVVVGQ